MNSQECTFFWTLGWINARGEAVGDSATSNTEEPGKRAMASPGPDLFTLCETHSLLRRYPEGGIATDSPSKDRGR
jgi:hypothetical protein